MEMLIILALAFGAMWLMTSRTRKQQREAADFRANLEVGQEVMTGSGLYGTIVDVDGDTITLESMPGNQSRWIRAAVAKLVVPADETVQDDDDDAQDEDAEYGDAEYDEAEYDDAVDGDGTPYADAEPDGTEYRVGQLDAEGSPVGQGRGATRLDRIDVPDDLSTIDDRRTDDGTDRR